MLFEILYCIGVGPVFVVLVSIHSALLRLLRRSADSGRRGESSLTLLLRRSDVILPVIVLLSEGILVRALVHHAVAAHIASRYSS